MKNLFKKIIILGYALFLTSCYELSDPGKRTSSENGATVTFSFEIKGDFNYTLVVTDKEGKNLKFLYVWHNDYSPPVWSPEGRVLFTGQKVDGEWKDSLWSIESDGTGVKNLFNSKDFLISEVNLSPDGRSIVFRMDKSITDKSLWILNKKGENLSKLLSFEISSRIPAGKLAFSPEGSKIAFCVSPKIHPEELPPNDFGWDIWLFDLSSRKSKKITFGLRVNPILPSPIDWSPDGTKIVFSARPSSSDRRSPYNLYLFDVTKDTIDQLTVDTGDYTLPLFFPGGSQILVRALRDEDKFPNYNYWKIDLKTDTYQRLTNFTYSSPTAATISPDGEKIAFVRSERIWIMDNQGNNLRRIDVPVQTESIITCRNPSWSKDGNHLAFILIEGRNCKIVVDGKEQACVSPPKRGESWLGIYGADNHHPPNLKELKIESGVIVLKVFPDSPASKAGILPDDVITGINEKKIDSMVGLITELSNCKPGEEIEISLVREGEKINTKAVLAKWPELE